METVSLNWFIRNLFIDSIDHPSTWVTDSPFRERKSVIDKRELRTFAPRVFWRFIPYVEF